MDSIEIFEQASNVMKWVALGGLGYIGVLSLVQVLGILPFQNQVTSSKELELVIQEEAEKLGIDFNRIRIVNNRKCPEVSKREDHYELSIDIYSIFCTRRVIRHELYHIFRGDCEKFDNQSNLPNVLNPYYLFVAEPKATIYGLFGVKI